MWVCLSFEARGMREGMRRLEVLFDMWFPIGLQAVTVRLVQLLALLGSGVVGGSLCHR